MSEPEKSLPASSVQLPAALSAGGNLKVSVEEGAALNAPAADSTANVLERDVVGSKADAAQTTVGTTRSIMAYVKGVLNQIAVLLGYHAVPTADAATNATMRDVIGSKTDAAVIVVNATKSLQAYVKGVLTQANAIKAKTDLIQPVAVDAGNLSHNVTVANGTTEVQVVEIVKTSVYALSVYASMVALDTAVEGGTITLRLYDKVDGVNYAAKPLARIQYVVGAESEHPSFEVLMVKGDCKLTVECSVAVTATRVMPYRYIVRDLGA